MKKILLSYLFLLAVVATISAQCTTCVPSYSGCNPSGGICGHAAVGMANHPYASNLSFYMPHKLNSPAILSQCSCSEVDLQQITVTGVGGLPTGINTTFNHANATYNVAGGDTLGCASFCGTPLAPGVYPVTIYIQANVLAIGTIIGNVNPGPQSQTYLDTMIILADTSGGIGSFNYTPHVKVDCDSLRLSFNGLLSAPSPNPTSYDWNFGGGNTSTVQTPSGSYLYNTPGIHPVSLKTTFYKYRLKKVFISSVTGGYTGDIEEPFSSFNPDPYFVIGALGYTSPWVNDTKYNIDFETDTLGLTFPLGTDTFQMQIWDRDQSISPTTSPDDLIGTYTIHIINGQTQFNWSNGNASGYVEFDTVLGTSIVDTLKINIEGRPAKPAISAVKDSLCQGDSVRMVISPLYSNVKYEWWRDSTFLLTATDSVYYAYDPGSYRARVTDLVTGCTSASDTPYFKLNVSGQLPTSANIVFSAGQHSLFLNPFVTGNYAEWYYNGTLVTGQNGQILPSLGPGIYKAIVYPAGYPQCSLTSADYTLTNVAISETPADVYDLAIYPNPNNGLFTIRAYVMTPGEVSVRIMDMLGRDVYQNTILNQYGEVSSSIDLSSLAKDVYTLLLSTPAGKATKRVVIK